MSKQERQPLLQGHQNTPEVKENTLEVKASTLEITDDGISIVADFLGVEILQLSCTNKKYRTLCAGCLNVLALSRMLHSMELRHLVHSTEFKGPDDFKFTININRSDFQHIEKAFSLIQGNLSHADMLYKTIYRLLMFNPTSKDEKYLSEAETLKKREERIELEKAIEMTLKNINTFYDKHSDTKFRATKIFLYNTCCCLPAHLLACGIVSSIATLGIFIVTALFFGLIINKLFDDDLSANTILGIAGVCSALAILVIASYTIYLYAQNIKGNIQEKRKEDVFISLPFLRDACVRMKEMAFVSISVAPRSSVGLT